jgi:hypothetical protein
MRFYLIFQYIMLFEARRTTWSWDDPFYVDGLFRTYIFTLAAAEADLLVDYFEQTIMKPQAEHRADLHASPTGTTMIQDFNNGLHCDFGFWNKEL